MNIGDKIECGCGAIYEASYDAKKIIEKDHARCQYCRLVIVGFPLSFGLKMIKLPVTTLEIDNHKKHK